MRTPAMKRLSTVCLLGALSVSLPCWSQASAAQPARAGAAAAPGARAAPLEMRDLIGANGWATSADDFRFWRQMGLSWGRDAVGPGRASPTSPLQIDKTSPTFNTVLPPILLANQRHGVKSLLLLGYTPPWNASVPGDSNSAPREERYWREYVQAVVKKYTAPPYNIKYFQIWNEAAGPLSGGSPQATFWHGPRDGSDPRHARPYADAMADYVNRIHLPAARIIHQYHAYVVYGGWPDQGGMDNYIKWLEYRSPSEHTRMLDTVDYLDVHYLGVADLDRLYRRYVVPGTVRGVWQTEIGDTYMRDPRYLPSYYFEVAVWALAHGWHDPNQYVSMIYHWDGLESFRLTHRGAQRTYNPSGRALVALTQTVSGALAPFAHPIEFGAGVSGSALYAGDQLVFQVRAHAGPGTLAVADLAAPASGRFSVTYVDALSGAAVPAALSHAAWQGARLSIEFNVPAAGTDSDGKPLDAALGYVVVKALP
jgi:hypothetical protein